MFLTLSNKRTTLIDIYNYNEPPPDKMSWSEVESLLRDCGVTITGVNGQPKEFHKGKAKGSIDFYNDDIFEANILRIQDFLKEAEIMP